MKGGTMEYIYAGMLLHSAKKPIGEASLTKILEAAGIKPDAARVKALVASLKDVNIDEAIKSASVAQVVQAAPVQASGKAAEKKEEKKAEEGKTEEEAAAGLAGLFG